MIFQLGKALIFLIFVFDATQALGEPDANEGRLLQVLQGSRKTMPACLANKSECLQRLSKYLSRKADGLTDGGGGLTQEEAQQIALIAETAARLMRGGYVKENDRFDSLMPLIRSMKLHPLNPPPIFFKEVNASFYRRMAMSIRRCLINDHCVPGLDLMLRWMRDTYGRLGQGLFLSADYLMYKKETDLPKMLENYMRWLAEVKKFQKKVDLKSCGSEGMKNVKKVIDSVSADKHRVSVAVAFKRMNDLIDLAIRAVRVMGDEVQDTTNKQTMKLIHDHLDGRPKTIKTAIHMPAHIVKQLPAIRKGIIILNKFPQPIGSYQRFLMKGLLMVKELRLEKEAEEAGCAAHAHSLELIRTHAERLSDEMAKYRVSELYFNAGTIAYRNWLNIPSNICPRCEGQDYKVQLPKFFQPFGALRFKR
eukprot:GHVU01074875.1.p1 GENE.GHVU01074875.1~~GHVU01074875.1.p1  ORF type:complete len:421 (+),score=57.82 GHVU01074875.1:142-1404(+)